MPRVTSTKLLALPGALRLAARIILQSGWIQKDGHSTQGLCLVRALELAQIQSSARIVDMHLFVSTAIGLPPYERFSPLMAWNDAPGRTRIQVLTALYKAAQLAEEKIGNYGSLTYQSGHQKAVLGRHPRIK